MQIIRTTTRVLMALGCMGLFSQPQSYAQGNNPAAINQAQPAQLEAFGFRALGGRMNERNTVNVVGSPYLYDEALPGTIYFEEGQVLQGPTRYDLINYRLVLRYHGDWMVLDPQRVSHFELRTRQGDTLTFHKASILVGNTETKVPPGAFWQVLHQEAYTLMVAHRKEFSPAENSVEYGRTVQKDAIYEDKNPDYFLLTPTDKLDEIKLRRGWLLRYFSERKPELKRLIKRENLSLSQEADVCRMLAWLEAQG